MSGEGKAVLPWQRDVHEDQVWRVRGDSPDGLRRAAGNVHDKAFALQHRFGQQLVGGVIFDHQNPHLRTPAMIKSASATGLRNRVALAANTTPARSRREGGRTWS